jgi:hypothetical protein
MKKKETKIVILITLIALLLLMPIGGNIISAGTNDITDDNNYNPQSVAIATIFTENFTVSSFTSNWLIYNIDGGGTWNYGSGTHTSDGSGLAQQQDGVSGADHFLRDTQLDGSMAGTYNISFWVYSTGAGEVIGVGADNDNDTTNGGTTSLTTYTTLAATTWEHYYYEFNASALGLSDPFYIYFGYGDTLYMAIDDIVLTFDFDDVTPPSSNVNSMTYWHTSLPVTITATATDSSSGVKEVTLYYRYSNNNASWGTWTLFSTDAFSPWQWSFNAPSGNGYYEFYTIAEDNASNTETAPGSADENAGIDTISPITTIQAVPSYGMAISSSSSITLNAVDIVSGVNATYQRIWNGTWYPIPGTGVGKSSDFSLYAGAFSLIQSGTNYVEYYSDDNVGNEETTHNQTYNVDASPPIIDNITITPATQVPGGYVNISCDVVDSGAGVDGVFLEVTYPDSSFSNFTMNYVSCTNYWRREVYTISGTYDFTIYAKDEIGNAIRTAVYHFTISSSNNPPSTPSQPSGTAAGLTGMSYSYTAVTTDSDGDNVYYLFDWGDSSNSGWVGPYTSGSTGSASHIWSATGTYSVRVKAKDVHSAESSWSTSLTVTISIANNPPVTTYTLDPSSPTGDNGWYIDDVNVTLYSSDPDGDAIAYTKYRVDSGSWITYNGTFIVMSDGEHQIQYYSEDDKGNKETTKSMTVKIDTSLPYIVLQRPTPGYLYLFDRQIWPSVSGYTVIIGRIVVRAIAYDIHSDITNASFYVNGIVQNIDTVYPFEWFWRGDMGYRYIHVVTYNKAGFKQETYPILVYIFSV